MQAGAAILGGLSHSELKDACHCASALLPGSLLEANGLKDLLTPLNWKLLVDLCSSYAHVAVFRRA